MKVQNNGKSGALAVPDEEAYRLKIAPAATSKIGFHFAADIRDASALLKPHAIRGAGFSPRLIWEARLYGRSDVGSCMRSFPSGNGL